MASALEVLEMLDARRRRGTYLVTTHSGTRYFLEVRKSVAGGMRVISDGLVVTVLRDGVVGGCGCSDDEPVVRVGQSMHLAAAGEHIVMTSMVASIERVEDGAIDALVCNHCCRGYKAAEGQRCRLCHH